MIDWEEEKRETVWLGEIDAKFVLLSVGLLVVWLVEMSRFG